MKCKQIQNSRFILIPVILIVLGLTVPVNAQTNSKKDTIRVLILEDFPPQFITTSDGPSGLAVEVMREVAKLASLKIEFVPVKTWKEVYPPLKNQTVDALSNIGISEARKKILEFTHPYEVFDLKLFIRNETTDIKTFDDLNDRLLGLQATNVLTKGLIKSGKYNIKSYPSFQDALIGLLSGEVDAVPAPTELFLRIARAAKLDNRLQAVGPPLLEVKRAIAVPKGRIELRDRLNKGLVAFKKTNAYPAMLAKWYGASTSYWSATRIAALMGAFMAVSLLLMGVWRYYSILGLNRRMRANEQRLRDFAEVSSDWFWEMDANLYYTYLSYRYEEIIGTKIANRVGTQRWDNASPQNNPDIWDAHKTDMANRHPFKDFKYTILSDDNKLFHLSASGVPVFDEGGKFTGYRGTTTNITESKRSEDALKFSEERLSLAMTSSNAGYWQRNLITGKAYWSDSNFRLLGYQPTETSPNYDSWLARLHPDDRESTSRAFNASIAGQSKIDIEYRVSLPDGSVRWIHNVGKCLRGFDKNSAIVTGIQIDITERKNLESQLRQAHRMEAIGQLTGGIAHDFNNLLSIMIGNAEILEDFVSHNKEAQHNITALKGAIDRASSLTSRLLAFSRKQNLEPKPTALNGLVLGLGDMLQRALGETVELKTHLGSGACEALIDPHQFENALINLAINARDAMPDGGVLVIETTNITLDKSYADQHEEVIPGDYVKVTVSDTGTGIPPETLEKVFEPFFTTKEVGEGSGLGLSMVYGFIKQSEGHITVRSEVNHGTIIDLYMPVPSPAISTLKTSEQQPQLS